MEVQRRAGVGDDAKRVGRIVSATLAAGAARLMAEHRLAVAASLDDRSRVWASLLTGPRGLLRPVDEHLMLVESHPRRSDPLARNLEVRSELGLLAIDLGTRRRMRFNGRALLDAERGIFLAVEQVYGNCPKYIQARRLDLGEAVLDTAPPVRSSELNSRQLREWRMASTRNNQRLEDVARLVNPVVRGWMNYYGRFYRSKCVQVLRHLNEALAAWARRKYKRFRRRERASMHWLGRIARRDRKLFVLWQLGVVPEAGG